MQQKETLSYYELIMGDDESSFKQIFHTQWLAFLDTLYPPYGNAMQLRVGSHLRPLLVYWGGALGAEIKEKTINEDLLELALCVEILHKTSIIVDDLIDEDVKRHNQLAFHIQFTSEETIIFAVYMLGIAFQKISLLSQKYTHLQSPFLTIYAQTLCQMAAGCLSELTLTPEKRYNYQAIVDIICKETTSLIKNSFLSGFLTNSLYDKNAIEVIEQIGEKVGYLFQVMNDLEPFCADKNLAHHKGTLNFDFNRSRKNIVLPYIYGCCSGAEKTKLLKSDKADIDLIIHLYQKYQIETVIKNDLTDIEKQLEVHFSELANMQINQSCLIDFKHFYYDIIAIAKKRLGADFLTPID